jgi:hypothetical protein
MNEVDRLIAAQQAAPPYASELRDLLGRVAKPAKRGLVPERSDSITFSTWIEAPRMAQLIRKLIDVAPSWGVKLKFTDHDRRFFRETIYFDVIGQRKNVSAFWKAVGESMREFNDEI